MENFQTWKIFVGDVAQLRHLSHGKSAFDREYFLAGLCDRVSPPTKKNSFKTEAKSQKLFRTGLQVRQWNVHNMPYLSRLTSYYARRSDSRYDSLPWLLSMSIVQKNSPLFGYSILHTKRCPFKEIWILYVEALALTLGLNIPVYQ